MTGTAIFGAGVIGLGIGGFSATASTELHLMNNGGDAILVDGGYTPNDAALYDAYLAGLKGLTIEELDALGSYTNRIYMQDAVNVASAEAQGTSYDGYNSQGEYVQDFVAAVDQAYIDRETTRSTSTNIDASAVTNAMGKMGLGSAQQDALLNL
ncbi:hypothetical protein [Jannaschia aquimarina]|uniref:hypothetical protein n=1 Tax=Jannaschia aquimarina TaxID=935700 RepID=UPI0005C5DB48|nr:hypothetical protein [Jannaschia aquimarina]